MLSVITAAVYLKGKKGDLSPSGQVQTGIAALGDELEGGLLPLCPEAREFPLVPYCGHRSCFLLFVTLEIEPRALSMLSSLPLSYIPSMQLLLLVWEQDLTICTDKVCSLHTHNPLSYQ